MDIHIKTTHVGSLPRPTHLLPYIRGEKEPPANYEDLLEKSAGDMFARQLEIGIDVMNDGELGRKDYVTAAKKRLSGFKEEISASLPEISVSDLEELTETEEINDTEVKNTACSGPIAYTEAGMDDLKEEIGRVVSAAKSKNIPLDQVFFSSPSPGILAVFFDDDFYNNHVKYVEALGAAMKKEYEAIHAAGLMVQIDCPDLGMGRHSKFQNKSTQEFQSIASAHIAVLNKALENIPSSSLRMHVCWGNYPGPHHHDVPLEDIIHLVLDAKPKYLSLEACNPGHGHEWEVFQKVSLPAGKVLMPGVLDTTTSHIEHPRLVAQRLMNYIRLVGVDRVMASTDCGFGSAAGAMSVPTEIVFAKLQAMVKGARVAEEMIKQEMGENN